MRKDRVLGSMPEFVSATETAEPAAEPAAKSPRTGAASSWIFHGGTLHPVRIEVSLLKRLPAIVFSGIPASSAKETAERVRSAIEAAGFTFPRVRVSVLVSMPGSLGSARTNGLDLAIAVAILRAAGIVQDTDNPGCACFYGELSLGGEVRCIPGVTTIALRADEPTVVGISPENKVLVTRSMRAYGVRTLSDLFEPAKSGSYVFRPMPLGDLDLTQRGPDVESFLATYGGVSKTPCLSTIRGIDPEALNGIALALTTRRPLLLITDTDAGAHVAVGLRAALGPMGHRDCLRVSAVYDAAGMTPRCPYVTDRPFRAPHHTITATAIVGTGSRPGELALAEHGIMLLDEVQEFRTDALEAFNTNTLPGEHYTRQLPIQFVGIVAPAVWAGERRRLVLRGPFGYPGKLAPIVVHLRELPGAQWPTTEEFNASFL